MTAYSNRQYKKSYKLGSKPITVLKKQTERILIRDIELMKEEIIKLELKLIDCQKYRYQRSIYESLVSQNIDPLRRAKLELVNNPASFKTGFIYLFIKKELKHEIKLKISELESSIEKMYLGLKAKYQVGHNPFGNYEISVSEIDQKIQNNINRQITQYQQAIQNYHTELEIKQNKNQRIEEIKGLAAQAVNKTRQQASQLKAKIVNTDYCPYCGNKIFDGHVDHIYPVAKGGLSSTKNMVRVCSECNFKKKDMTLNQFIKKYDLDRDVIEENLDLLNKSY